jgi:hypothetical protein
MNPHSLCYLCFTGIIQPLNVVQMWVWACGQAKLLDQIRTHQVIAATEVNDNVHSSIVDDEESLEQNVALLLLGLLHLGAKDMLHNSGLVCHRVRSHPLPTIPVSGRLCSIVLLSHTVAVCSHVL